MLTRVEVLLPSLQPAWTECWQGFSGVGDLHQVPVSTVAELAQWLANGFPGRAIIVPSLHTVASFAVSHKIGLPAVLREWTALVREVFRWRDSASSEQQFLHLMIGPPPPSDRMPASHMRHAYAAASLWAADQLAVGEMEARLRTVADEALALGTPWSIEDVLSDVARGLPDGARDVKAFKPTPPAAHGEQSLAERRFLTSAVRRAQDIADQLVAAKSEIGQLVEQRDNLTRLTHELATKYQDLFLAYQVSLEFELRNVTAVSDLKVSLGRRDKQVAELEDAVRRLADQQDEIRAQADAKATGSQAAFAELEAERDAMREAARLYKQELDHVVMKLAETESRVTVLQSSLAESAALETELTTLREGILAREESFSAALALVEAERDRFAMLASGLQDTIDAKLSPRRAATDLGERP